MIQNQIRKSLKKVKTQMQQQEQQTAENLREHKAPNEKTAKSGFQTDPWQKKKEHLSCTERQMPSLHKSQRHESSKIRKIWFETQKM